MYYISVIDNLLKETKLETTLVVNFLWCFVWGPHLVLKKYVAGTNFVSEERNFAIRNCARLLSKVPLHPIPDDFCMSCFLQLQRKPLGNVWKTVTCGIYAFWKLTISISIKLLVFLCSSKGWFVFVGDYEKVLKMWPFHSKFIFARVNCKIESTCLWNIHNSFLIPIGMSVHSKGDSSRLL